MSLVGPFTLHAFFIHFSPLENRLDWKFSLLVITFALLEVSLAFASWKIAWPNMANVSLAVPWFEMAANALVFETSC